MCLAGFLLLQLAHLLHIGGSGLLGGDQTSLLRLGLLADLGGLRLGVPLGIPQNSLLLLLCLLHQLVGHALGLACRHHADHLSIGIQDAHLRRADLEVDTRKLGDKAPLFS